MADYEFVSSTGVIVPDTATLRAQVESEWREAFGQDLVTSPETPQGVLITAEVEARDGIVRNNAALANQINPDIAGGIYLDAIWQLTRGARQSATRSVLNGVMLGGVPATVIPAGSLAAVAGTGDLFETVGAAVIQPGGTVEVSMQSVEFGPIQCGIGQLVNVASSVLGWETVTNPTAATPGRLVESDLASRRRRRQTLALQSVALPEAITSRLMDIDGVNSLVFRENTTNAPAVIDGVNLVAHSIYVCVDGGTDQEVASALLATKSLGAGWNGSESVVVVEPSSGQSYTVNFDRPTDINVFIRVTAKFNNTDGQVIIKQAILAYAAGELEGDGGFFVGQDVSPWELAGAINQVEPRIGVVLVELSLNGVTYNTNTIDLEIFEKAVTNEAQIAVIPA